MDIEGAVGSAGEKIKCGTVFQASCGYLGVEGKTKIKNVEENFE